MGIARKWPDLNGFPEIRGRWEWARNRVNFSLLIFFGEIFSR